MEPVPSKSQGTSQLCPPVPVPSPCLTAQPETCPESVELGGNVIKSQQESSPPEPPNPDPWTYKEKSQEQEFLCPQTTSDRSCFLPLWRFLVLSQTSQRTPGSTGAVSRLGPSCCPPVYFGGGRGAFLSLELARAGRSPSAFPLSPAGAEPGIPWGGIHVPPRAHDLYQGQSSFRAK